MMTVYLIKYFAAWNELFYFWEYNDNFSSDACKKQIDAGIKKFLIGGEDPVKITLGNNCNRIEHSWP